MTVRVSREEKLAVRCPKCHARPYEKCFDLRRPSLRDGRRTERFHTARRLAALDAMRARGEATGDCYEAAGRGLMDAWLTEQDEGLMLVHGVVTGQGPIAGRRIGHAWIEDDNGTVIDKSNGKNLVMRREVYYAVGEVDPEECHYYRPADVRLHIANHKTWGPWQPIEGEIS